MLLGLACKDRRTSLCEGRLAPARRGGPGASLAAVLSSMFLSFLSACHDQCCLKGIRLRRSFITPSFGFLVSFSGTCRQVAGELLPTFTSAARPICLDPDVRLGA